MASKEKTVKVVNDHGPAGWVMFTAWVGAVIYFYNQDPGFWGFILAMLKGAVWPGYVLYHVLTLLSV